MSSVSHLSNVHNLGYGYQYELQRDRKAPGKGLMQSLISCYYTTSTDNKVPYVSEEVLLKSDTQDYVKRTLIFLQSASKKQIPHVLRVHQVFEDYEPSQSASRSGSGSASKTQEEVKGQGEPRLLIIYENFEGRALSDLVSLPEQLLESDLKTIMFQVLECMEGICNSGFIVYNIKLDQFVLSKPWKPHYDGLVYFFNPYLPPSGTIPMLMHDPESYPPEYYKKYESTPFNFELLLRELPSDQSPDLSLPGQAASESDIRMAESIPSSFQHRSERAKQINAAELRKDISTGAVYSFGIMMYKLLFHRPPYGPSESKKWAEEGFINFPKWRRLSAECFDVLQSCLRTDPTARPTFAKLREFPFFASSERHLLLELFDGTLDAFPYYLHGPAQNYVARIVSSLGRNYNPIAKANMKFVTKALLQ